MEMRYSCVPKLPFLLEVRERAAAAAQSGSSLCILFLYVSAPNSVVDDQQIQHIDMYLGGIVYHGDGKTVFAEKQRKV